MKQLGISVYPEHTTDEKCREYMRKAGALGFKRVFTCFLSAEETREEMISRFKAFCDTAHEAGLKVSADTNPQVFRKLGATPHDLSVFHEIGIDIVRLDEAFNIRDNAAITHNPYGIMIEYNSSGPIDMRFMIENGADAENMCMCNNFYPMRHTGNSLKRYIEWLSEYRACGLRQATFISSNNENTFGPWKVYDGLCTLEMHRDLPIDLQLRHLNAINLCQDILIGNCFASDEELKLLAETDLTKINFRVEAEKDISDAEREILYWDRHASRPDTNESMLRSTMPRIVWSDRSIPCRPRADRMGHRGDVVILNDNIPRYKGELWVLLEDMELSDEFNLAGRVPEQEQILLEWIRPGYRFGIL